MIFNTIPPLWLFLSPQNVQDLPPQSQATFLQDVALNFPASLLGNLPVSPPGLTMEAERSLAKKVNRKEFLSVLARLTKLWSSLAPASYLAWNPHPGAVASGPGMKERWRVFPKEKKADDGSWSWQKFTDLKISALRFCFDPSASFEGGAQIYSCNLSELFFIWGKSCAVLSFLGFVILL